jgi:hypothetical protein
MPVEGAVVGELFDSLGWSVYFLDVAAFSMAVEAVRIETKKEEPNIVVFMCSKYQYRYAKQYVGPLRKELPRSLFVASTDLNPVDLKKWLPELDFCVKGVPTKSLHLLATRTQTRNFEGIQSTIKEEPVSLPQYHPLTTNFEQHARLRNGRIADIPIRLFGQQVDADSIVDTIVSLRLKYAMQGFNLVGEMTDTDWLMPILKQLEERELVGAPANLTWTCDIPNPMHLSTPIIRQLADYGNKVLMFEWRPGVKDQIEHILSTTQAAMVQPMIRFTFDGDRSIYDYVEMAKLLQAHENLPVQFRFVEDEAHLNDEAYVASLTNGNSLPKSQSLHKDVQLLIARDLVLSRDVERLEKYAEYTSH